MSVMSTTDATFSRDVLEASGLVIVDFWAPWCGPCRMIAPVLEELSSASTFKGLIFKMNLDEESQIPEELGVRSIPTLMLFKNGTHVDTKVGFQSKGQLEAWVAQFS